MKNPHFLLPLLIGVALCGCAKPPTPFSSPDGRFSVTTPKALVESIKPVDTEVGPVQMHIFTGGTNAPVFMAAYADYPVLMETDNAERVLDGSRAGALANMKGKLVSEKKITLDGHPGREVLATGSMGGTDFTCKLRLFLVGHRLYEAMVLTTPAKADDPEVVGFLDSFKLLAGAPSPGIDPAKPVEFKSDAGRFTVMTPVKLAESTKTLATADKTAMHMFLGNEGDPTYMVAYLDTPTEPQNKDVVLDSACNGAKGVKGTLISTKPISLGNYPGREAIMTTPQDEETITIKMRIYLVGRRLYQLQVLSNAKNAETPQADAFLQSFKLLPAAS